MFATILDREKPLLKDLEAWISAARDHHEAYLVKKHKMEFVGPRARWITQWATKKPQQRYRDKSLKSVPMDVDVIKMKPLTDEERKQLAKEGHCFFCKAPGHLSKVCPKKKSNGGTLPPYAGPSKNRVAEEPVESVRNMEMTTQNLEECLINMQREECNKMMNHLVTHSDF